MPLVAETFKGVINEMTYRTNYKLEDSFNTENVNLTYQNLDTSIDKLENW